MEKIKFNMDVDKYISIIYKFYNILSSNYIHKILLQNCLFFYCNVRRTFYIHENNNYYHY